MTVTQINNGMQWPLTVLFDGANTATATEIKDLKAKDKEGRLRLADVSAPDFKAEGGVTAEAVRQGMHLHVHVRDAGGKVLNGVSALEAIYEALGLGSWFRYTRKPGLVCGRQFAEQAANDDLKKAA